MSTESLEELLRLDAELPDGEGSDIDEILYISEVIAKRDREQPTGRYSEADVDAAWETFQTKYLPYATDSRSLYDFDDDDPSDTKALAPDMPSPSGKKRISARGRHRLGRVATIVAAIALLLGLMTLTAYAMGYDLWGVIAQWTKDTFTFVSASKVNDAELSGTNLSEGEYEDLQAALDAYGVTKQLAPKWVPSNYVLKSVEVDGYSDSATTIFQCNYAYDDLWIIMQIYMHHDLNDLRYSNWQKDDTDVTSIKIETQEIYFMENAGRQCAVWTDGSFECSIIADVSSEELYKIIKSIYEE